MASNTNNKKPGGDTQSTATANKVEANPIDPSHLRLSQNFAETVGVKKVLNTVPVRKPNRQDFVRAHPSEEYRLERPCWN